MRLTLLIIFLSFSGILKAPEAKTIFLRGNVPEKPYRVIQEAIGYVESKFDTLAINEKEQAYGYFQIRHIRLDDYFQRTGIRYSLTDMLDYEKAERVFLYYATRCKPCEIEKIARTWNGGYEGMNKKSTIKYWQKVQKEVSKSCLEKNT